MTDPALLVTGRYFGGEGLRGVMPVMQQLVQGARDEIHVLAYVMTGQALPLLAAIEAALVRGIKATIVINVIPHQPLDLKDELGRLAKEYSHATVRYFHPADGSQLHAKILVVDRKQAVVGSANYTWGGLVSNHEIGVLLSGKTAWDLGRLADKLALNSSPSPEPND